MEQPGRGYIEDVTDLSHQLMRTGRRWRLWFAAGRMTAISCSAMVPVTAATAAPRWVLALLGAVAVVAEGAISISRFDQRGLITTAIARDMLSELRRYKAKAAPYNGPDAVTVLVDRIEGMHHSAFASMTKLRLGTRDQPAASDADKNAPPGR